MKAYLALIIVLGWLAGPPAQACSCEERTVEQVLAESDAVFVGKVVRLELVGEKEGVHFVDATVEVLSVAKGSPGGEVVFHTSDECCTCGYFFEIAKRYLIYADSTDRGLDTSACSRTELLEKATDDLKALGIEGF